MFSGKCAGAEDVLNYFQSVDVKLILLTNEPAQRQVQKICRLALDHRVDAYYMSQENKSQSQKVPHFLTFFRTLLSTYKND